MREAIVNYRKATELVRNVIYMYDKRKYPFNQHNIFPDAKVPEGIVPGSKEHALFLFYSVSLDSMRQANKVYAAVRSMFEVLEGDLSNLHRINKERLESILSDALGQDVRNPGKSMTNPIETVVQNSKLLAEKYDGDPRHLVGKTVKKTLDNMDEFVQYGIPKAALLLKNFVRFGMCRFSEYEIPIKVDRHTMRISLGCGVINPAEYIMDVDWGRKDLAKALVDANELLIRQGLYKREDFSEGKVHAVRTYNFVIPLTLAYMKVTKKEKISAIKLNDAFWAIGAHLCKANDGIVCKTACDVGCEKRYPSDNTCVWFFVNVDKRGDLDNLFNL